MTWLTWLESHESLVLAGTTFLLCAITFLYVVATWRLVRLTERASGAAAESARHAAVSAEAAERSALAQERAAAAAEAAVPTTRMFVMRALAAEIEALRSRYEQAIGGWFDDAESKRELPQVAMLATQDYFTVFNANADWVGSIGEGVETVVRWYVLAKAHIEGHMIWAHMLSVQCPEDEKWRYFRLLREEQKALVATAQEALEVLRRVSGERVAEDTRGNLC